MRINGRFRKELYPWEQFLTVRIVYPQIEIEQIDEEKMLLQGASSWEIWLAHHKKYEEKRDEIEAQQKAEQEANKKFIRCMLENPSLAERYKGKLGRQYCFLLTGDRIVREGIYRAAEKAGIPHDYFHTDRCQVIPTDDLPSEWLYPKGIFLPHRYIFDSFKHSLSVEEMDDEEADRVLEEMENMLGEQAG